MTYIYSMILDNFNENLTSSLLLTVIMVFFAFSTLIAQEEDTNISNKSSFKNNVRFGGNVGLSAGNGFFTAFMAPSAVYDFNSYFSAGTGFIFSYTSGRDFKNTIYGPAAMVFFRPYQGLRLSAEYEQLRVSQTLEFSDGDQSDNFWNPALFLGLGYTTGKVTAGLRYNVLFDEDDRVYGTALLPFVGVFF